MTTLTLAIPTQETDGQSLVSDHFGHCTHFTVCKIIDNEIVETRKVPNQPHQSGGCLAVVNLLAANGADAVIAKGMGMRPLSGLRKADITPYRAPADCIKLEDALTAFKNNNLQKFDDKFTCGGQGSHD